MASFVNMVGDALLVSPVGHTKGQAGSRARRPMVGIVRAFGSDAARVYSSNEVVSYDEYDAYVGPKGDVYVRESDVLSVVSDHRDDGLEDESAADEVTDEELARDEVYSDIDREYEYAEQFGGPDHDDSMPEEEWVRLVQEYAANTGEAQKRAEGRDRDLRERMLKVATIAVRAVVSLDRQAAALDDDEDE